MRTCRNIRNPRNTVYDYESLHFFIVIFYTASGSVHKLLLPLHTPVRIYTPSSKFARYCLHTFLVKYLTVTVLDIKQN